MDAFHSLVNGQRMLVAAALVAATLFASPAGAEERASRVADRATADQDAGTAARMRPRGWTVHLDNDLFAFTEDDRDYTAGISVTLGGKDAAGPKPLSRALDWIDRKTGFGADGDDAEGARSFEVGVLLFTPQDLDAEEPLFDDRPYANLAYLSSSRLTHDPSSRTAYQSSLTVGVLGMPWVEHLHRTVHVAFGSREPKGYRHQISDGGEPTARYAVSRYRLLRTGTYRERPYHLRFGLSGSIGYLTEASADLAFRWGNLNTPWWSSSPSLADYGGHPPIRLARESPARAGFRLQVAAGVSVRLRAYNAFLQGQFRSSDVTYSASRLNPALLEAWLGVTTVFRNNLSITYTLRHQTEEIRTGDGSRESSWASIAIAQQF